MNAGNAVPPTAAGARTEPAGRWFCERCGRRYAAAGDCPHCDQEPLLDLSNDHIRLTLQEDVERRRMRRYSTFIGIALVVGVPVYLAVGFLLQAGDIVGISAAAAATLGIAAGLMRLFPVRSTIPSWTGDAAGAQPAPAVILPSGGGIEQPPLPQPAPVTAGPPAPMTATPQHGPRQRPTPAAAGPGIPGVLLALLIWMGAATVVNVGLVAGSGGGTPGAIAARVLTPVLLILGVLLGSESVRMYLILVAGLQVGLSLVLSILGFATGHGLGITVGIFGLLFGALPAAFMIWCLRREDTQRWMLHRSLGMSGDEP